MTLNIIKISFVLLSGLPLSTPRTYAEPMQGFSVKMEMSMGNTHGTSLFTIPKHN